MKQPKAPEKHAEYRDLLRLWPYLRTHRRLVIFAALLIPVVSLLEMAQPLIVKRAIDRGIMHHDMRLLSLAAALYLVAVIGGYAARSGQSLVTSLAINRMIKTMRTKLVAHVLSLAASFHDRSMSGALVTRATSDFDNLSESLNQGVLTSVVDCAVLVGSVVGMLVLSWRLALVALVLLPLVGWLVAWFSKALKHAMLKARRELATLNAFTQECLYGHATVKLLTAEESASQHFDKLNYAYRDAQMGSVVLDAFMFSVLDGVATCTVGLILWLAVTGVIGSAVVSAGLVVAFVQYVQQMFEPLKQLGNKMAMLQGAFASIERIFGLLDTHEIIPGGKTPDDLHGRIAFEHVTFRYQVKGQSQGQVRDEAKDVTVVAASKAALTDVSFEVAPGESLAIVGATGGGKSTIVKLLTRLYAGYEGRITLDGCDISELDAQALRRQMAIVPQDIVLFDGTVAFNIGLGVPGITRAQIERAAKLASADEFIDRLPGGFDFHLTEHGSNLSHGQRQLIAFARALAKDPAVVILDEATSSVDCEAEAAIQQAIETILEGRTVIVIAHRLATIRKCHRILVVQDGRIVESGSHQELLARRGAYYQLYYAKAEAQAESPSKLAEFV